MLQSLIVYGFLGLSLWWLGTNAANRERVNLGKGYETSFFTWEIVFSLLLFALISGIRWKVGTDHQSYLANYNDLIRGLGFQRDFESGFAFISSIFAYLKIHFTVYFAFWAFLQLFFVYYAFKNERYIIPFLGLLILFGGQYHLWMNGIRQAIAASIFVFSIQFITDRRFVKYIIAILFATLFHQSAIVLIIFYFIPNVNYFKNRYITIMLLIATIFIGLNPYWLSATENMSNILSFIGYDKHAIKLDYIITEQQRDMSFGPRRLVSTILYIVIIWFYPYLYRTYKNKNTLLFFNLAILGALHYNLFANTSSIFLRPTYYFTIFTPIISSYILAYFNNPFKEGVSLRFLLILFLSVTYLPLAIIAESGKGELDFTNYKFFWDFVLY